MALVAPVNVGEGDQREEEEADDGAESGAAAAGGHPKGDVQKVADPLDPKPDEQLKDYFARTRQHWLGHATVQALSGQAKSKAAYDMATQRFQQKEADEENDDSGEEDEDDY